MARQNHTENPREGGLTFDDARRWCVPFGSHRGKTIAEVALSDAGLLWLEYSGEIYRSQGLYREALRVFLNESRTRRRIEEIHLRRDH